MQPLHPSKLGVLSAIKALHYCIRWLSIVQNLWFQSTEGFFGPRLKHRRALVDGALGLAGAPLAACPALLEKPAAPAHNSARNRRSPYAGAMSSGQGGQWPRSTGLAQKGQTQTAIGGASDLGACQMDSPQVQGLWAPPSASRRQLRLAAAGWGEAGCAAARPVACAYRFIGRPCVVVIECL